MRLRLDVVLCAFLAGTCLAQARAPTRTKLRDPPERPAPPRDRVAGGEHWRIPTDKGAVHLWRPAGYRPRDAGIVLYIHGHNLTTDQAWDRFKLSEQFRASRQNALFILPDAPRNMTEEVKWRELQALLRIVAGRARMRLPRGPIVALAHSGAYRTVSQWLSHPRLDHVVLLDALYGQSELFQQWIDSGPRHEQHRLYLVSRNTRAASEAFTRALPYARSRSSVPGAIPELSRREKRARVLHFRSQYDHNGIITSGKVIPLLLRLTRLRRL